MKRHQVLIVAAISVLVLAGCTNAQQPTIQTSPAASPAATGQTDRAGVDRLLSVVSNTKAAVEAGNFSKANTEFSQFEDNWKQVEDGIKAKSSDRYKAIEDSLDRVTGELKGSQPNKQNVLADLQSMENNINSVAKL